MKNFSKLIISVLACEFVGVISTQFTIAAIPAWYAYLNKPSFSPPNWIFGPVWTIMYFLMGVSAFLVWQKGFKNKKVKEAMLYFLAQLFFNFIWSILFFGLRSPLLGLLDILVLLVFVFITLIKFHKISKTAAYLLIPYILWVSFASILNISIVTLNR